MASKNFVMTPEGQELAVLCLDLGYKLAESPGELTRAQINFLIAARNYRMDQLRLELEMAQQKDIL